MVAHVIYDLRRDIMDNLGSVLYAIPNGGKVNIMVSCKKSMDGLLVRRPFAQELVSGTKKIEFRSRPLPEDKLFKNILVLSEGKAWGTVKFKRAEQTDDGYEWHVISSECFTEPKNYIHPKGARIWIRNVVFE